MKGRPNLEKGGQACVNLFLGAILALGVAVDANAELSDWVIPVT
jgi:hypothetical protein